LVTNDEFRESLSSDLDSLGISQTAFAAIINVPLPSLAAFISGRRAMKIDEVQRLHKVVCDLKLVAAIHCAVPLNFARTEKIKALMESHKVETVRERGGIPVLAGRI
jgi:predicted transcriptional regulator